MVAHNRHLTSHKGTIDGYEFPSVVCVIRYIYIKKKCSGVDLLNRIQRASAKKYLESCTSLGEILYISLDLFGSRLFINFRTAEVDGLI